jgi:hypothetical protein
MGCMRVAIVQNTELKAYSSDPDRHLAMLR